MLRLDLSTHQVWPEPLPVVQRSSRRRWLLVSGALALAGCGGGGGGNDAPEVPPVAPVLDIRSDVVGDVRSVFTVTFSFSAPVLIPSGNLAFALSGGSAEAGSFTRVNDRTYTVRVRPNASGQGLIDLRVPIGAFQEATGRVSNAVAYAFSQPYDTLPPVATLRFNGPVNALGFITGPGSMTLTFNGVLDAPLTSSPLRAQSGAITGFVKSSAAGQADVYTFTYTPPAATLGGVVFDLPANSVRRNGIGNDAGSWSFGLSTGP